MPNAGTEVITVNECLNTVECRVFKTDSGIPAALYGAESEKIFCVYTDNSETSLKQRVLHASPFRLVGRYLPSIFRSTVSAQATPLPALTHGIPCRSCRNFFVIKKQKQTSFTPCGKHRRMVFAACCPRNFARMLFACFPAFKHGTHCANSTAYIKMHNSCISLDYICFSLRIYVIMT